MYGSLVGHGTFSRTSEDRQALPFYCGRNDVDDVDPPIRSRDRGFVFLMSLSADPRRQEVCLVKKC